MTEIKKIFKPHLFEASLTVNEEHDGLRLDQYLASYFKSFSRQQIKKKISNGDIRIQNRPFPHKSSVKVYSGEVIEVQTKRGKLEDVYWCNEKVILIEDIERLYEDENILIINKPPFMSTHPTGQHLFYCATVYLEDELNIPLYSIHRLDRETSGVLILAKNSQYAQQLTQSFEDSLVKKCYFLISHKRKNIQFPFEANERLGEREDFIPRMFAHCFDVKDHQGKHALTKFYKIFESDDYILSLAYPKTGRQHQIRSHAAFHGLPLLGDKLYNGDVNIFRRYKDNKSLPEDFFKMQIPRHALHAVAIKIPYKELLIQAPIPEDLAQWINENLDITNEAINLEIQRALKDTF